MKREYNTAERVWQEAPNVSTELRKVGTPHALALAAAETIDSLLHDLDQYAKLINRLLAEQRQQKEVK